MGTAEPCACGLCDTCKRRAGIAIATYAQKQRSNRRWGRDAYVRSQVKLLLAMTGLSEEEDLPPEELRRSEWGAAMRDLRKITEGE